MRPDDHGVERGYDMELHRNRGGLVLPLTCVIGGGVLLVAATLTRHARYRFVDALGAAPAGDRSGDRHRTP
ncbi:hypothetical protein ABT346_10475 [Micromonospora peucetia]|uniref:hypothetical protein n=1 Tax=Micromonospora peucetia TaxID=47871 RepID=UPI00332CC1C3